MQPRSMVDDWWEILRGSETPPELSVFLASRSALTQDDVCELFLVDQQTRWATAPGTQVEEYLRMIPKNFLDVSRLVDLIYGEARACERLGIAIDVGNYCKRFPVVHTELIRQFTLFECLNETQFNSKLVGNPFEDEQAMVGEQFGDYELMEPIACSPLAVVFKARHRTLQTIVALKMIPPDRFATAEDVIRFQNEATTVTKLDHPGIMPILDAGEWDGMPYFTSRYVETGTLDNQIGRFRKQNRNIAKLILEVAKAVHHAHIRGILHRDIKPSNILIDSDGRPFVTDFGLAKLLDAPDSDEMVGTPAWMAPEIAGREIASATVACDVYGIGAVLYFLLTGRVPFKGAQLNEVLAKVVEFQLPQPSQLDPTIPPELERICLKSMEKEPTRRYPSAQALGNDLTTYLGFVRK